MSSVLTTSMSGMLAHQAMLDVTANNIANSETSGFKSGRVDFADQLYRLQQGATQPGGTTGGRDPSQVGNGVQVAGIATQFTQGPIQPTGRDLDLAINGTGFFRLRDASGVEHYSRVGSFGLDGGVPRQLVDLATGYQVLNTLGTTISPVDSVAAAATTKLTLAGNLPPTATAPLTGAKLSSLFALKKSDGTAVSGSTLLSSTTLARAAPGGPVTVNLFGAAPDGQPYSKQITLAANATVQDLVNGLNGALNRPSGLTTETFATVSLDQGKLNVAGSIPGDQFNLFLGEQPPPVLPASTAIANSWQYGGASDTYAWSRLRFTPDSVATTLPLFTADGTKHAIDARWFNSSTVTTGTGQPTDFQRVWDLVTDTPVGGSLAAGGDALRGLTFNTDGSQLSPPTGVITSSWTVGGASTMTVDTTNMRGYQGDGVADATDLTGYAAGTLNGISVDQFGVLNGSYSNGKTVPMSATGHQIGLVTFTNPGGLLAQGQNLWAATGNSGAATQTIPGTAGINTITPGALEGSNVDMTSEFTRLIVAQRGFQSNSRAFQTGDQLLTEAFSLFR